MDLSLAIVSMLTECALRDSLARANATASAEGAPPAQNVDQLAAYALTGVVRSKERAKPSKRGLHKLAS